MKFLKSLTLCLALLAGTAGLTACGNTLHGAGQDIENAGEEVQDF